MEKNRVVTDVMEVSVDAIIKEKNIRIKDLEKENKKLTEYVTFLKADRDRMLREDYCCECNEPTPRDNKEKCLGCSKMICRRCYQSSQIIKEKGYCIKCCEKIKPCFVCKNLEYGEEVEYCNTYTVTCNECKCSKSKDICKGNWNVCEKYKEKFTTECGKCKSQDIFIIVN